MLRDRKGITLVEVLVACAIVALLMAVLLPAVQAVRALSRKVDCSSRMKQVGIAVHSYHATHSYFPPSCGWAGWRRSSVWSFLLAELELNDAIARNREIEAEIATGTGLYSYPLPDFVCRPAILQCPAEATSSNKGANFAVNWGGNGIGRIENYRSVGAPNGCFAYYLSPPVGMASIVDGTSNTAMASEFLKGPGDAQVPLLNRPLDRSVPKALVFNLVPGSTNPLDVDLYLQKCVSVDAQNGPVVSDDRGGLWLGETNEHFTYSHYSGPNTSACWEPSNLANILSAGSRHGSGVNVLFADGSVRFVSDNVDLTVWRAIGTRAGSESVTGEF